MRARLLSTLPLALLACGRASERADAGPAAPAGDAGGGPQDGGALDCAALLGPDAGFAPFPHRHLPPLPPAEDPEGGIVSGLRLVTITASNDPRAADLQTFGDALVQSRWFRTVGAPYGLAPPSASLHVADAPPITSPLSEGDVIAYVEGVIADGGPAPDGRTLYLLYAPDAGLLLGTEGYHEPLPLPGPPAAFAAVAPLPFPIYPETTLDEVTVSASHEVIEAATDFDAFGLQWNPVGEVPAPWTLSVWDSAQGGANEIADVCEATRTWEAYGDGGFWYQRVFDEQVVDCGGDDFCVPREQGPDYDVTFAQDWYPVDAGASVAIPFTGWSTGPLPNWFVFAFASDASSSCIAAPDSGVCTRLALATQLGPGLAPSGCNQAAPALNDGIPGTLTVQMGSSAQPGDWEVFAVASQLQNGGPNGCDQSAATDYYHAWYVGVYVP